MKDYIALFSQLNEELEKMPGMQVEDFYYSEEADVELLNSIESDFSIKFSNPVRTFYSQCNGMNIKWKYEGESENGQVAGRIWLQDIEEVFYGPGKNYWKDDIWNNKMSEEEQHNRKLLKPFDYFDPDDSGCACFDVSENVIGAQLIIHSVDNGMSSLNLNFENYLETALKTRGIYGWHYLYANLPPKKFEADVLREDFKKLFGI